MAHIFRWVHWASGDCGVGDERAIIIVRMKGARCSVNYVKYVWSTGLEMVVSFERGEPESEMRIMLCYFEGVRRRRVAVGKFTAIIYYTQGEYAACTIQRAESSQWLATLAWVTRITVRPSQPAETRTTDDALKSCQIMYVFRANARDV